MQITHYTARKQIAFELNADAAQALRNMEERTGAALNSIPLKSNLTRLENVSYVEFGPTKSPLVYVDFEMNAGEENPSLEEAAEVIAAYAEDAVALERFLPGFDKADSYTVTVPLDIGVLTQVSDDRTRRLVHLDSHFIVMAPQEGNGLSVHFIRNGAPFAIDVEATASMLDLFASVRKDSMFSYPEHPILATRHLEEVRDWIRANVFVPTLEAEFADGYLDLDAHKLSYAINSANGDVVYLDDDLFIIGSRNDFEIHFEDNDTYLIKTTTPSESRDLSKLLGLQGLVTTDDNNPVRTWLRRRVSFDAGQSQVFKPQI